MQTSGLDTQDIRLRKASSFKDPLVNQSKYSRTQNFEKKSSNGLHLEADRKLGNQNHLVALLHSSSTPISNNSKTPFHPIAAETSKAKQLNSTCSDMVFKEEKPSQNEILSPFSTKEECQKLHTQRETNRNPIFGVHKGSHTSERIQDRILGKNKIGTHSGFQSERDYTSKILI